MKIKNIAVFLGGCSSERDISLKSGYSIVKSLLDMNFFVYPIDMKYFSLNFFLKKSFDKVFIALHGKGGEDGTIQGLLDYLNISYTGSGVLTSSIAINKFLTKLLVSNLNINIIPNILIDKFIYKKYCLFKKFDNIFCKKVFNNLGIPVVVKPNTQGSSIGIKIINNIQDLQLYLYDCYKKFGDVLIEKYIYGKEYTVGVLNKKILPIIRIKPKNIFYDYKSKYILKNNYFYSHNLDTKIKNILNKQSLKIWNLLKCRGCIRIDFLIDNNNRIWFLEINTIPGMTNTSLIPYAANIIGISFNKLVKEILYS